MDDKTLTFSDILGASFAFAIKKNPFSYYVCSLSKK